jgi:hypothetical protein
LKLFNEYPKEFADSQPSVESSPAKLIETCSKIYEATTDWFVKKGFHDSSLGITQYMILVGAHCFLSIQAGDLVVENHIEKPSPATLPELFAYDDLFGYKVAFAYLEALGSPENDFWELLDAFDDRKIRQQYNERRGCHGDTGCLVVYDAERNNLVNVHQQRCCTRGRTFFLLRQCETRVDSLITD